MHLPCGVFNQTYEEDITYVRTKLQWGLLIALLVLFCILPLVVNYYIVGVMISIFTTIIIVIGLNVLTGYTGLISLGHAGFALVGAYGAAVLGKFFGVPFWLAIPAGAVMAGLVGIFFGLPALRMRGFYLALATLAAQFIITWVVTKIPFIGCETFQVPLPEAAGIDFGNAVNYYYIVLGVTVLVTYGVKNLSRSRFGRAWMAIRDNDFAAEVLGINLFSYKLWSFFISCFLAGLGGALFAYYTTSISVEQFTLNNSIWYLGYLVVGGMGTMLGPFAGTFLFMGLNEILVFVVGNLAMTFTGGSTFFVLARDVIFGLTIVLFIVFEPKGLAHRWGLFRNSYRLFPFSY